MSRPGAPGFGMRRDVPLTTSSGVYLVHKDGFAGRMGTLVLATSGDPPREARVGTVDEGLVSMAFSPTGAILRLGQPTPAEALLARRAAARRRP